jgi:hypothetical protein
LKEVIVINSPSKIKVPGQIMKGMKMLPNNPNNHEEEL